MGLELTFPLRLQSCLQLASSLNNSQLQSLQVLQVAIMSSQALTRQRNPTISSQSPAVSVSTTRMASSTLASLSMLLNQASAFDSVQCSFFNSSFGSFGPSGRFPCT